MRTLPKTLLALAIVGFAISLTGPGSEFADGVIKPFSAICFILFYITNVTGNVVEAYDREQDAILASIGHVRAHGPGKDSSRQGGRSQSFAGVTAH